MGIRVECRFDAALYGRKQNGFAFKSIKVLNYSFKNRFSGVSRSCEASEADVMFSGNRTGSCLILSKSRAIFTFHFITSAGNMLL
jgi:hypothetical protein